MGGRRQRGFSLLELLVALLVIVLATSLVTLNIGSGDSDVLLDSAVRDIAEGANYALDEAQFTGMDYGLLLTLTQEQGRDRYHYAWRERAPGGWREPASGKGVFAAGDLPDGLQLQLEVEEVILPEENLFADRTDLQPQVVLYASGETLPGSIDIRSQADGELLWRIEWGPLGDFRTLRRGLSAEQPL